jgi:hypothetical protein
VVCGRASTKKILNGILLATLCVSLLIVTNNTDVKIKRVHASGITKVQGPCVGFTTGNSISVSMSSTPTAGNLEVAVIESYYDCFPITISQSGVSWSSAVNSSNSAYVAICYGNVSSGASTSITITFSASARYGATAVLCEYTFGGGIITLDKTASNTGSSGSYPDSGTTSSTSIPDEVCVAGFGQYEATFESLSNGFALEYGNLYGYEGICYADKITSSIGTEDCTVLGVPLLNNWAGCIATFFALSSAPANTSLQVDPSCIHTSAGQSFDANIRVYNVTGLYLWVFSISWNPSVLQFVNTIEGDFLGRGGTTLGVLIGEINQTGGYLKEVACSLTGSVQGVDGDGTLATITFKVNDSCRVGSSDLNVYFFHLLDSKGNSISCTTVNGVVEVGEDLSIASVDMPYATLPKYVNVTIPFNLTVLETGTAGVDAFNVSFVANWVDGGITEHSEKVRVDSLGAEAKETLSFHFAPSHTGNHTLTFTVDCDNDIVEFNETNNVLSLTAAVKAQGDINGDNQTNYEDLFILARAYWSTQADPNWNPNADMNYDGILDYKDLFILERNYS